MDAIDRIIDQLYDGATDAAAWSPALNGLCDLVGGGHALTIVQDAQTTQFPFTTAVRVDPAHLERFLGAMAWGMSLLQPFSERQTFDFDSVVPRREFLRSDFFNDVIRPMGGYRSLLSIPFRHAGYDSFVAVCRPAHAPEFSAEDAATIGRIVPHVARAMRTKLRVDESAGRLSAALGVFDKIDVGLAIVDRELRPVVLNRRAEQMVARHDGLTLTRKGLAASSPSDSGWLQRLVRHAAQDDARVPGHYAMRLHRPDGPAWSVVARRLDDVSGASGPLVVLMIEEEIRDPRETAALLGRRFGLSPREAALAAELANGSTLAMAADRLGIGTGTARNHLKAIFAKTGTHRQAELVALFLRATRFGG